MKSIYGIEVEYNPRGEGKLSLILSDEIPKRVELYPFNKNISIGDIDGRVVRIDIEGANQHVDENVLSEAEYDVRTGITNIPLSLDESRIHQRVLPSDEVYLHLSSRGNPVAIRIMRSGIDEIDKKVSKIEEMVGAK